MLKRISAALVPILLVLSSNSNATSVEAYAVENVTSRSGYFDAQYTFKRTFAANDPLYPNRVDYVKRNVSVPKTGNPLNWVKNNGLTLAVTGAVLAAGYAIDELTNQVVSVTEAPPDGYTAGYYFFNNQITPTQFGQTPQKVAENYVKRYKALYSHNTNVHLVSVGTSTFIISASGIETERTISGPFACRTNTNWYCVAPEPVETIEPVADAELWTLLEPVFSENPLTGALTDSVGNPYYFQPVADAADAIGATMTGYTDYSGAIVTEPVGDAPQVALDTPPINLEIPTDYAREETSQSLLENMIEMVEVFKEEIPDPQEPGDTGVFDLMISDLDNEITNLDALGDFTTDFNLPDYSATCQTLSYSMLGSTFTFPSTSQCDKLAVAKEVIGWLLYIVTAMLILELAFRSRA